MKLLKRGSVPLIMERKNVRSSKMSMAKKKQQSRVHGNEPKRCGKS